MQYVESTHSDNSRLIGPDLPAIPATPRQSRRAGRPNKAAQRWPAALRFMSGSSCGTVNGRGGSAAGVVGLASTTAASGLMMVSTRAKGWLSLSHLAQRVAGYHVLPALQHTADPERMHGVPTPHRF